MGVKLRSAPVFYTLVQFKFNPIAQISNYVPSIQEKLRHMGFPDFNEETKTLISMRRLEEPEADIQKGQQKRWVFNNANGDEGYLLLPDALVFHTTNYDTFETFSKKAINGLKLVHEEIDLSYLDRIGLRYLDFISPGNDETVEDYLSPYLLGLSTQFEGSLNHAFSETAMDINGGKLIARSVITENNGLALPPDLVPLNLKLPEKFDSISGKNVVLDVDYFVRQQRSDGINLDLVDKQMIASHKIVTDAFNSSVTKHAIETWGK